LNLNDKTSKFKKILILSSTLRQSHKVRHNVLLQLSQDHPCVIFKVCNYKVSINMCVSCAILLPLTTRTKRLSTKPHKSKLKAIQRVFPSKTINIDKWDCFMQCKSIYILKCIHLHNCRCAGNKFRSKIALHFTISIFHRTLVSS
jgi:hypothetical protein